MGSELVRDVWEDGGIGDDIVRIAELRGGVLCELPKRYRLDITQKNEPVVAIDLYGPLAKAQWDADLERQARIKRYTHRAAMKWPLTNEAKRAER